MKKCAFILRTAAALFALSASAFAAESPKEIFVFSDQSHKMPENGKGASRPMKIGYEENGVWKATSCDLLTSFFGARHMRHLRQMTHPYLFEGLDGEWHCVWAFGKGRAEFGHSHSKDMVVWRKQNNAALPDGFAFLKPIVKIENGAYTVKFISGGEFYKIRSGDLKSFTEPQKITKSEYADEYTKLSIGGREYEGVMVKVPESRLKAYLAEQKKAGLKGAQCALTPEKMQKSLEGVEKIGAKLSLTGKSKKINPDMFGVFYEDIGFACDGCFYPECVQNRDFEFLPTDRDGYNSLTGWTVSDGAKYAVKTAKPLSKNNPHYIEFDLGGSPVKLVNDGWFEGVCLQKDAVYDFSVFVKSENPAEIKVRFSEPKDGYPSGKILAEGGGWKKYSIPLKTKGAVDCAKLVLEISGKGKIALDMVSLFPRDTFMGRKNGLRKDIARLIADLKPRFVRFPGGCVVHADSVETFYRWQNTIGALQNRKPTRSVWKFHQTFGLGYAEYFDFCEDIGAKPIPIVPAGVSCQVMGQKAVPMRDMPAYVQEVLDLVEWATGDPEKTKWGKVRAANGRAKPYNLEYLGIGNEDEMTENFKTRFLMIKDAVNKKYPHLKIIGSSGIISRGQDYNEGNAIVKESKTPIIDDHYYCPPEWFIANADFYDAPARRGGAKIYLGEYAPRNRPLPNGETVNDVYSSLASALYLMNLERNGDVVEMFSYAPLVSRARFQNKAHMILVDNKAAYPTSEYYMQKLFSENSAGVYLASKMKLGCDVFGAKERVCASVLRDEKSGETILKLVNILPVPVELEADISEAVGSEKEVRKTLYTGKSFSDQKPQITETETTLGGAFTETLPPYSFTILRFAK